MAEKKRIGTLKGRPIVEIEEGKEFLQTKNELRFNSNTGTLSSNTGDFTADSVTNKMREIFMNYIDYAADPDSAFCSVISDEVISFIKKHAIKCWPSGSIGYATYGNINKIAPYFATYREDLAPGTYYLCGWNEGCQLAVIKIIPNDNGGYKIAGRGKYFNFWF